MSVRTEFHFACSGCPARVSADAGMVSRRFVSVSGRDYGIGSWVTTAPTADAFMPEGWSWDLHTPALYCPTCWTEIYGAEHEG